MKVAIAGFDREGRSTFNYIRHAPEFRGADIWILDRKTDIDIPHGVNSRLGKDYLKDLDRFDVVFRTPGIKYLDPAVQKAVKRGVKMSSLIKLFFEKCPGRIVGVTGTKGKGTTSSLIYAMLKAGGKRVHLAGNIGTPALDILPKIKKGDWVVLELSSFQLMDMETSPHIAVALMVTSEHMDWHKNVREYVAAKSNIVKHQKRTDFAVLAADYPRTASYARLTKARTYGFSRRKQVANGTFVKYGYFWFRHPGRKGAEKVCPVTRLKIPGEHNWDNAAAAITAAKLAGVSNRAIERAIASFKGLEHRLEFVREFRGVRYYNDSYSTTPETAEVAIAAFEAPKIIVLGGSRKGSDFRGLGRTISKSKSIRAIIGIGLEWPRIKRGINNRNIAFIEGCRNMREIVRAANRAAEPGDVVILSPACASFDMFRNYSERGRQFKEFVKRLK